MRARACSRSGAALVESARSRACAAARKACAAILPPSTPDNVTACELRLAHAAALRDRLTEMRLRVSALLDELETAERTSDGTGVIVDATVRAIVAEPARLEQQVSIVEASARLLMTG